MVTEGRGAASRRAGAPGAAAAAVAVALMVLRCVLLYCAWKKLRRFLIGIYDHVQFLLRLYNTFIR